MNFDLDEVAPSWLALVPDLRDILNVVDTIQPDQWHKRLAETLDFAYRVRFARVLMNHPSTEEMEALALHLEDVADDPDRAAKLDAMAIPYASRWRMLRNVLEDRLAVRELAVPETVTQRRQIRPILEQLRTEGRLSQQQLIDQFQLTGASLSRTLGLMEGWELVVRDKMAKEQWLFLGPRAGEAISPVDRPKIKLDVKPSVKLDVKPGVIPGASKYYTKDVLKAA